MKIMSPCSGVSTCAGQVGSDVGRYRNLQGPAITLTQGAGKYSHEKQRASFVPGIASQHRRLFLFPLVPLRNSVCRMTVYCHAPSMGYEIRNVREE